MSQIGTFLRGGAPKPNAARARLRVTLARRLVETQGAPFVPSEEVFSDVASARDELGLMRAAQGPTVVRVQVKGGTASEQEAIEGDWLVDPDAGDRVLRLPEPRWDYDDEAVRWVSARPWVEAWETCEDGRWMLHAARMASIDRRLLVLAACACVRTALRFIPEGEQRPLRAIETAERWARGEATLAEARTAANVAYSTQAATDGSFSAGYWAISAAYCAAATALGDYVAAQAAYAVFDTARAWAATDANTWATVLARCADLVRGTIPTLAILRTVATPT